jgi:hypothetical protein
MLVKLGDFIFTLHVNWRDTSSYIYKSVEQKIALTVSFGKTRDGITLEEFVGQQRQELSEAMNDDIEYLTQEQSTVDSLPAVNQSFSFCVQSKKYQEYWSTAYYGENKYLRLSYVGLLKDKMLKATFDHILASSLLSSRSQPEKKSDHYVWRQANILRLQIPDYLQSPKHYTYASQDGSLKLKVSLYSPGDTWLYNRVEIDAAKDLRFGGHMGTSRVDYQKNLVIQQVDYLYQGGDPIEPQLYRAHRAQISGFGALLFLFIKGHESQTSQIDAFWLKFMNQMIENNKPTTN